MEEELTPTGKVTKGTVLRLFLQVHRHKPTGNLYLKEGSLLRIFYFSKGRYAYGQSNIAGEKLAELIREEKALPEELLQDALSQQAAGEYLGRILLQKGYLTPLQLSGILEKQQKRIFASALESSSGEYKFFNEELPAQMTPLNRDLMEMIKEGIYGCQDRRTVLALVGGLQDRYEVKETEAAYCGERELKVLQLVEEKGVLSEVLQNSFFDDFTTLKIIAFLLTTGVIAPRIAAPGLSDFSLTVDEKMEASAEEFFQKRRGQPLAWDFPPDQNPLSSPLPSDLPTRESFPPPPAGDSFPLPEATLPPSAFSSSPVEGFDQGLEEEEEESEEPSPFKKAFLYGSLMVIAVLMGGAFYLFQSSRKIVATPPKPPVQERVVEKKPSLPPSTLPDNKGSDQKPVQSLATPTEAKAGSQKVEEPFPVPGDTEAPSPEASKSQPVPVVPPKGEKRVPEKRVETPPPPASQEKEPTRALTKPGTLPDHRALLRRGDFEGASRAYKNSLGNLETYYTVRLEVDCTAAALKDAVTQGGLNPNLFLLPKKIRGKSCHAVLWGLFRTRAAAEGAIQKLPDFFRLQKPSPEAVLLGDYLK